MHENQAIGVLRTFAASRLREYANPQTLRAVIITGEFLGYDDPFPDLDIEYMLNEFEEAGIGPQEDIDWVRQRLEEAYDD